MTAPKFDVLPDGTPLSTADAEKILAKLKPAKPRKIVKWKGVAKATDEKLHQMYRERDALLVMLGEWERRSFRYVLFAVAGWLAFVLLLIAWMVEK